MIGERPPESTPDASPVDEVPLVFTDGVGGAPLPDPGAAAGATVSPQRTGAPLSPGALRSLAKPPLGAQPVVAERPCAKCTKPVRVDLLSCPFCAHRFERLSREPVAKESVQGGVVPAALAVEFAEQRERDTVASRLERERRMSNRLRLTAVGVLTLVLPAIVVWSLIAPSRFLVPAIVAETISAWIVMRTLLRARGGSMAGSIAVTPSAAIRLFGGMSCAFALEPSIQRPGELIMGTEGRGAAAIFAMIAGSVVVSYVLATVLGVGVEQSEGDYAALQPARPRTFKQAFLEVVAGFRGAFTLDVLDPPRPRLRAAEPQPVAAFGAAVHPDRIAPLEEPSTENLPGRSVSTVAFLAGPGLLYWLIIMIPLPWLLIPVVLELAVVGVVWKLVPRRARVLALALGVARIAVGITVCIETHHPVVAGVALILGLVVSLMNDAIARALDAGGG